jgi:ATP-dependent Clp protease adaptor protein ClpS
MTIVAAADPPKPPAPPRGPQRDKDGGTGTETVDQVRLQKPKLWRVLMHNDDFTTQQFVIHVLEQFFRKDPTEAHHLMLKVHMTGKAIVAVYTRDIAETKVEQVSDYAREQGHPLMLTLEPDGGDGGGKDNNDG